MNQKYTIKIKKNWKNYYNNWAETYNRDVRNYGYIPSEFCQFLRKYIGKNMVILDAGCGTGLITECIKDREGAIIIGLDLAKNMLEKSRNIFAYQVIGDAEDLPFRSNIFDIILSFELIEVIPNPQQMVGEFYRVLKPGGLLILSAESLIEDKEKKNMEIAPEYVASFTERRLKEILSEYFSVINIFPLYRFFIYELLVSVSYKLP